MRRLVMPETRALDMLKSRPSLKSSLSAKKLLESHNTLAPAKRQVKLDNLITLIVSAFESATKETIVKEAARLMEPVKHVIKWMLMSPITAAKLERHQQFVDSIQHFSKRVPGILFVGLDF
jgi:hypothetical protein